MRNTIDASAAPTSERCLRVVMYHYVRDLQRTRFPRLKALLADDFRDQVSLLSNRYEMATLESALAFLQNRYRPSRDLCLLTFDDGLREHYEEVLPVLAEKRIQGLFFVITSCIAGRVVSVHKNHFLMAHLSFDNYEAAILKRLAELDPGLDLDIDAAAVQRTYRWDTPEVGRVKYLLNFHLPEALRDRLLDDLFAECFGDERTFASELYLTWDHAREMQSHNMVIGGHSHTHVALGAVDEARQFEELSTCSELLRAHLRPQAQWPFSYPYGKPGAYTAYTVEAVRALDFASAFATSVGDNCVGQDPYSIRRIDTKDVHA